MLVLVQRMLLRNAAKESTCVCVVTRQLAKVDCGHAGRHANIRAVRLAADIAHQLVHVPSQSVIQSNITIWGVKPIVGYA